jgi:hypothetical protein
MNRCNPTNFVDNDGKNNDLQSAFPYDYSTVRIRIGYRVVDLERATQRPTFSPIILKIKHCLLHVVKLNFPSKIAAYFTRTYFPPFEIHGSANGYSDTLKMKEPK